MLLDLILPAPATSPGGWPGLGGRGGALEARVEGFKSVGSATLRLAPLTLILGPPASGKSNLLEALEVLGFAVKTLIEAAAGEYPSQRDVGRLDDYVRAVRCSDLLSTFRGAKRSFRVALGGPQGGIAAAGSCESPRRLRLSVALRGAGGEVEVEVRALIGRSRSLRGLRGDVRELFGEEALPLLDFIRMFFESKESEESVAVKVRRGAHEGGGAPQVSRVWAPVPRLYGFDRMNVLYTLQHNLATARYPESYMEERGRNLGFILYSYDNVLREVQDVIDEVVEGIEVHPLADGGLAFFDGGRDVGPSSVSDTLLRAIYGVAAIASNKVSARYWEGRRLEGGGLSEATLHPIVMLEEPESHMHPWAFGGLARYLVDSASEGLVSLVVTTHSGSLADLIVGEALRGDPGLLGVYYFQRPPGGATRVYRVSVDRLYAEELMTLDELIRQPENVIERLVSEDIMVRV